ncbi:Kae1-associated serine/threonine protein kinase [Candidatus Pacearchaeota archaeon]|nr:Kae1-associated serine/threonine protein kinase [Candidatus Pacearchaeota archaeon]
MKEKIIQIGAEANIILTDNFIIKDRIKKFYRIPELDEKIRRRRTKSEAKLLEKASKIINCPVPFISPSIKNSSKLKMPFIDGKKLSDNLNHFSLKKQKEICKILGENIAKLHDSHIIHGDLTTSNMILKENKIYLIDFGLGFISSKIEDKAVDLHLLKQALEAKHFQNWEILFKEVLKGYKKYKEFEKILEQFKKVEKRGRYKGSY